MNNKQEWIENTVRAVQNSETTEQAIRNVEINFNTLLHQKEQEVRRERDQEWTHAISSHRCKAGLLEECDFCIQAKEIIKSLTQEKI